MKLPKKKNHQTTHFIVYVRWDIILDWKGSEIVENRLSKYEHLKPYAYGTGAKGIKRKVENGDILWILTIPIYGKLSSFPLIVAILTVDEVIDQLLIFMALILYSLFSDNLFGFHFILF